MDPIALETLVAANPQVILWLVGHSHDNRIQAVAGQGENPGYWEVMTAALVDWPAQTRVLEIVDNGNGTLSIFGTNIDYDEENCLERRHRRLTIMDFMSGWSEPVASDPLDQNVELVIPIPASAAAAVAAASANAPTRIESETTLRGM